MLTQATWLIFLMQSGLVEGQWWWQRIWGSPGTTTSPLPTAVSAVTSSGLSKEDTTSDSSPKMRVHSAITAGWKPGGISGVSRALPQSVLTTGETVLTFPKKTTVELELEFKTAKRINLWKQKKAGNLSYETK